MKHPQLGMVRVFLFFDGSMSTGPHAAGCALPVTHTGSVLPAIGVDAFVGAGFGFANPATDITGNMFVKYQDSSNSNNSNGGVVVLVPSAGGFENVISYQRVRGDSGGYLTGVNDYYSVELIGPVDGVYAIRQTENICDPDCASGNVTVRNLHWDGKSYVPDAEPPPPSPVTGTAPPSPAPGSSPAQTGCVEGSTKYSSDSGITYTCENGRFHEGPYGYQGGG
jgi:hypothetical protein